jgi:hypothetical protein
MSQLAASPTLALYDRYFLFEPWLIGSLFATSGALATYLVAFLLTV